MSRRLANGMQKNAAASAAMIFVVKGETVPLKLRPTRPGKPPPTGSSSLYDSVPSAPDSLTDSPSSLNTGRRLNAIRSTAWRLNKLADACAECHTATLISSDGENRIISLISLGKNRNSLFSGTFDFPFFRSWVSELYLTISIDRSTFSVRRIRSRISGVFKFKRARDRKCRRG